MDETVIKYNEILDKIKRGERLEPEETEFLEGLTSSFKQAAVNEAEDAEDTSRDPEAPADITETVIQGTETPKAEKTPAYTSEDLKQAKAVRDFMKVRGWTFDQAINSEALSLTQAERAALVDLMDKEPKKSAAKESPEDKAEHERLVKASQEIKDKEEADRAAALPGLQKQYANAQKKVSKNSPITTGLGSGEHVWDNSKVNEHIKYTENLFNDILCRRDPETKEYLQDDLDFAHKIGLAVGIARANGKSDVEAFLPVYKSIKQKFGNKSKDIINKLQDKYHNDPDFTRHVTGMKSEMDKLEAQRDHYEQKENNAVSRAVSAKDKLLKDAIVQTDTGALVPSGKGAVPNKSVNHVRNRAMRPGEELYRNGTWEGARMRNLINEAANVISTGAMTNPELAAVLNAAGKSDMDHTVDAWNKLFSKPGARLKFTLTTPMIKNGSIGVVYTNDDKVKTQKEAWEKDENGKDVRLKKDENGNQVMEDVEDNYSFSDFLSKPNDVKNLFKALKENNIPYELEFNGQHQDKVAAALDEAIAQGDPNILNDRAVKEGIVTSMDDNGFITERNLLEKGEGGTVNKDADNYYEHLAKILGSASPEQLSEYLNDKPITQSRPIRENIYYSPNGKPIDTAKIDPTTLDEKLAKGELLQEIRNPVWDEDQLVRNTLGNDSADKMRESANRIYSFLNALYGTNGDVSVLDKALDSSALNSLNGKATAAYQNWQDKLLALQKRNDELYTKEKNHEDFDPKEREYVANEYRKLLNVEGPTLRDTFKNIINNGLLSGNSSWSKISPRTSAEDFRDIALVDFVLDSYNRKRNKANKDFFDPSTLRDIIDENLKTAERAKATKTYDGLFGENNKATEADVQEIIDRLKDLKLIWGTPKDLEDMLTAIPDDVKKERLSNLNKYDDSSINRLKEAKSRIEDELANPDIKLDNESRLLWKQQLDDINSRIAWMEHASPEIEQLAKDSGKSYGEALIDILNRPVDESGKYTEPWMQEFMKLFGHKWDIKNQIRDLLGGSKVGDQSAKRKYTVDTLNALKEKIPGAFGKLFEQIDKAQEYDTGIPKGQLINMLLSRDPDRRANATQLLGGKLTPAQAAKWMNNKEALRSDYSDEHFNDTKTWIGQGKGSAKITKDQMKRGEADTSDPRYEIEKLRQDMEMGIPGAAEAYNNAMSKIRALGPSDRSKGLMQQLVESADMLQNILSGIKADDPGAN